VLLLALRSFVELGRRLAFFETALFHWLVAVSSGKFLAGNHTRRVFEGSGNGWY
jgi:hypothetical protein